MNEIKLKVEAPEVNMKTSATPLPIQADWAEDDPKARAYIKNKPELVKVDESGNVVLSDVIKIKFLD